MDARSGKSTGFGRSVTGGNLSCTLFAASASQRLHRRCDACLLATCGDSSDGAADLRRIVSSLKTSVFRRGAVLYRQGQLGNDVHLICAGLTKLVQYSLDGCPRIVRLLHTGDAAGLEALMARGYQHTVFTVTDTAICLVPNKVFELLTERYPAFRSAVMQRWQGQLETADLWIGSFATGAAHVRVARLIRYLISIGESSRSAEVDLLGHEDMASIVGVAPESVCREIAKLRRSGVIRRLGPARYQCDAGLLQRASEEH